MSTSFKQRLKNTIHRVYTWGIEERLITRVQQSPVFELEIDLDREEKRPEVLTIEEIRELHQLKRGDLDRDSGYGSDEDLRLERYENDAAVYPASGN